MKLTKYETCAICTGFIFCTFYACIKANKNNRVFQNDYFYIFIKIIKYIDNSFSKVLVKRIWISNAQCSRANQAYNGNLRLCNFGHDFLL